MRGYCLKYLLLQIRNISGKQLIVPKMFAEPIVPIVQKIDTPQFKALFTPELIKLNDLFKKNDFQLRMAGGAVRDLLMGIKPCDIDFATNATPEKMKELFLREGIRMLNKNGEEHGTITCRIDDKENFEITTLRIDTVCDGRRAKIEFTTNWQLDANRRDLTVNSLFLDLDGTVIDYFGGIKDLEERKIVFVGDANQRIQEDYLRILRYFRFYGRLAIDGEMHDKATLDAIISNRNGLKDISGERIWMELKKICVGRLGGAVLTTMLKRCNLASLLGLPEKADTVYFCKLHKRYYPKIEAMTLLSSLFTEMGQIEIFHRRCKLSYAEKTLTEFIVEHRDEAEKNVNSILFFKNILLIEERLHKFTRKKIQTSREKVIELAKYAMVNDELINELSIWEMPTFPIGGIDLMHNNISPGPHVKQILDYLFQIWIESEWMISKEELLKHINDIEWTDKKNRVGCKRKLSSDAK
uniref:BMA-HPO-31 n=1 Tax=Brugia malayi TaxID=6279 RepID=A0A0H5S8N7_BRUMA|nr:BMA-HPO-31 [Brugia malayi]